MIHSYKQIYFIDGTSNFLEISAIKWPFKFILNATKHKKSPL